MRQYLFILIILVLQPVYLFANTIVVAKDGTGDFTVIQDAIDVAEPYDIIEIGPGTYTEFSLYMDYGVPHDVCINVTVSGLSIIGAGPGQTIVGPYSSTDMPNDYKEGILAYEVDGLIVEGIKFVNFEIMGNGITLGNGQGMVVRNCEFENMHSGIFMFNDNTSTGYDIHISDCLFKDIENKGIMLLPTYDEITVTDCSFINCIQTGHALSGGNWAVVDNCLFDGTGFNSIQTGTSGVFSNNTVLDFRNAAMSTQRTDIVTMEDCITDPEGRNLARGFVLGPSAEAVVRDNVLITGNQSSSSCIEMFTAEHLHSYRNHLSFSGEDAFYLKCGNHPGDDWTHTLDATNCWFGTTDMEYIQDHIYDGNDYGQPWVFNIEPIADGPVSNEDVSWGQMKVLFR
ncbi:MAG: DUF1565 domain-containing protein [bacterium]|nr:DUF1565 domain-containing protein [bacterium]